MRFDVSLAMVRRLPFVRVLVRAGALALLVPGCFTDAPPLTSADAGDEESDDDGSSAGDDGDAAGSMTAGDDGDDATSNGSGSMSSSATTSPESTDDAGESDDSSTEPVDTSDDDTSAPCGELGEACCAGDTCNRGECNGSACVAFRGAYMDTLPCETCSEADHLPTLSGCDCDGFPASSPFAVFTDTCMQELPHVDAELSFCQAGLGETLEDSDWGGAYMVAGNAICGDVADPCAVTNAYTGSCDCPDGMDEIPVDLQGPCSGGGGLSNYELRLCSSHVVEPISFGGAFQTLDDGTCAHGNPRAGTTCDCPAGFEQQWLRIISSETSFGSTLVFCVGSP